MKPFVLLGLCALFAASSSLLAAEKPPHKPATPAAPVAPAVKEGTWTGTITEKGENWLRIKNTDGKSERFMPQWIGGLPPAGGLDKAMLEKIHAVKVGDPVTLKWLWNERYRVIDLTVNTPAPAGGDAHR